MPVAFKLCSVSRIQLVCEHIIEARLESEQEGTVELEIE